MARLMFSAPAHPRSRGENQHVTNDRKIGPGSSPLTRGKLDGSGAHLGGDRLIPAHAGKTSACAAEYGRAEAHPRSRGENEYGFAVADKDSGSSPLTRGKHTC